MIPVDESGDEAGEGKHGSDGDNRDDHVARANERRKREAVEEKESMLISRGGGFLFVGGFVVFSGANVGIFADNSAEAFGFVIAESWGIGN